MAPVVDEGFAAQRGASESFDGFDGIAGKEFLEMGDLGSVWRRT